MITDPTIDPWPTADGQIITRARARQIHKRLGGKWLAPVPFGVDGARFDNVPGRAAASIIVTGFSWPNTDGGEDDWIHASMAHPNRVPMYSELANLHRAVYGDGWAYQMFAPEVHHINVHDNALHLWGAASGDQLLPNFAAESGMGMI